MADSAEQKKKDARFRKRATERKRKAAEAKEKRRLAKVPQRKGGTAAPKLYPHRYRSESKEGKKFGEMLTAKGQKEIEGRLTPEYVRSKGVDTRVQWDVGKGGKRGQLRGADIPLRTADILEERARKNPARGAHRGQSVGAQGKFSHGGSVDTTSPENEAYFASMTQKVYTSDKDKT
jgi:hypothetical protein